MISPEIYRLDPEIAYLVLLTRAGLKPLSRWEAGLNDVARRAIEKEGLIVDSVHRRARIGRRVTETVFATKSRYVDLYRRRYDGTRLRDTPGEARFQGRLFGYPSCCVESFVDQPYAPNGLDPRDQRILFHWACPSCRTTPGILREYRRANAIWGKGRIVAEGQQGHPRTWGPGRAGKVAASLALAAGTAALAIPQNPHQWYALDDGDRDGLSVAEEMRMGTNWHLDDTDRDQVNDGLQMGGMLAQQIMNPWPWINVNHAGMAGSVTCEVCGEDVNMGYVEIHNFINGLSMQLNYIDIHALENGCMKISFRYCPSPCGLFTHVIDLDHLKRVLMPDFLSPHPIPPRDGDGDGDGLTDAEEAVLGTDPASGADGAELADELLAIIERLPRQAIDTGPYLLEHEMDGVEQCEACGETFNMGMVEVVSPRDGMSVLMPYVALHMLAHGGFAYDGTTNDGEVLPLALRTVLTANGSAHWVSIPGDTDDDGLMDSEEPFFGLSPVVPDEDNTGAADGRELAWRMAARIYVLPEGPLPGERYVIHHLTHGHYDCLVCGEPVNMGYMSVTDPVAATTVDVPYYSHHFMERGSFSTDRDDLYPRVDPTQLGPVLGITSITGVGGDPVPAAFSFQTSPNPFGPENGVRISLSLPESGQLEVIVYDVKGRRVRQLFAGEASGTQLGLRWDGRDDAGSAVGSGVYFCRAQLGRVVVSRKMTVIR
jgi:hypothetical protein